MYLARRSVRNRLGSTREATAHWVDVLSSDGLNGFEADLMLPQITEIILIKKPFVDAETKLVAMRSEYGY
jgi:hypothetical protein